MGVEFQIFGEIRARVDGADVDLGPARQRSVLAALLFDLNHVATPDQLVDRVWGERAPRSAAGTLRSYLSRLRAAVATMPGPAIERRPGGYLLRAEPATVDLHRFESLLASARAEADDESASARYQEAFAVWRGEVFSGLESPWFATARHALEAVRYEALLDYHDLQLRRGTPGALLGNLTGLVAAHPQDERLAAQFMLALYRSGRQADALKQYAHLRALLVEQLGTEPGPALRRLHQRILTADAALIPPRTAAGTTTENPVPRQLPAPPMAFTGRSREIGALSSHSGGPVVISALAGTGGIGKTWLALHWAHEHIDSFPDGQLYANLRGFDPASPPTPPEVVLREFLTALGTEPAALPAGLDALAALFRSLVTGRRLLIVLDNVRDTAQVVPLLPGGRTCTVLVTSRRTLAGLVSAHSARSIALDVLSAGEARELFIRHLGERRVTAEADAVTRLLDRCAGLPLALSIVAARALVQPGLALAALVRELDDQATRLDALDTGEPDLNLRAVLWCSFRALSPAAATLFGLLGLVPGPDIGLTAAGSLAALPDGETRTLLRELESHHLVSQSIRDRYRTHDLVHLYAAELAREHLDPDDLAQAQRRLVDYYTHTASAGEVALFPQRRAQQLEPAAEGCRPDRLPDGAAAMTWFQAEHACLLAVQRLAVELRLDGPVWQLAWSLATFHNRTANVADRLAVWLAALDSIERLDDRRLLITAHRYVANAYAALSEHEQAMDYLMRALDLAERLGDAIELGHTHYGIAAAYDKGDDSEGALKHAIRALACYETLGPSAYSAQGHSAVGWFHARLAHHDEAQLHSLRALELYREQGSLEGEAGTLDTLGYIEHHRGDHASAIEWYQQSIEVFRRLGHRSYEAEILDHLAEAYAALGDVSPARLAWRQAREIYRAQERDADAQRVAAHLDALSDA
jgi:DNA-binding SARP family transcriptional activator/tetratricopeptide (TPR) repeat protein